MDTVWDTELVTEHHEAARQWVANTAADQLTRTVQILRARESSNHAKLESPLEAVFELWWNAHRFKGVDDMFIEPQVEVEAGGNCYRLDYQVHVRPGDDGDVTLAWLMSLGFKWDKSTWQRPDYPRLAVEVDGHTYHERTREQVRQRDQRDRDLQVAGWKVLHFSYSELVNDPMRCVESVVSVARTMFSLWLDPLLDSYREANGSHQDGQA